MNHESILSVINLLCIEYKDIEKAEDITYYLENIEDWASSINGLRYFVSGFKCTSKQESSDLFFQLSQLYSYTFKKQIRRHPDCNERFQYYISPSLNRFLSSAYVRQYITIFDFQRYKYGAKDYYPLFTIDPSFLEYGKQYCKEYYEFTILKAIEYFNPDNFSEDYDLEEEVYENNNFDINLDKPTLNQEEIQKNLEIVLNRIKESYGKSSIKQDTQLFPRIVFTSNKDFESFMYRYDKEKVPQAEILDFIGRTTHNMEVDMLELLFADVINYVNQVNHLLPTSNQINERKRELIITGNEVPKVPKYSPTSKRLILMDDVERLFPEIIEKYSCIINILKSILHESYFHNKKKEGRTNVENTSKKNKKSFTEYFQINDSDKGDAFVEFAKKLFKDAEKGKKVAFTIRGLKEIKLENGNRLLEYNDRKGFYQALESEVGYIGTHAGINKYMDVAIDKPLDTKVFNDICVKIIVYLNKHFIR